MGCASFSLGPSRRERTPPGLPIPAPDDEHDVPLDRGALYGCLPHDSLDDRELRVLRVALRGVELDPALAVGKRVKRGVAEGAPLRERDLESVPVIAKGDLVTLVARVGAVTATARGVALAAAGPMAAGSGDPQHHTSPVLRSAQLWFPRATTLTALASVRPAS